MQRKRDIRLLDQLSYIATYLVNLLILYSTVHKLIGFTINLLPDKQSKYRHVTV